MNLGLENDVGEYVRFKPSINAWFVDGEEVDIKGFHLDPATIKTGYGKISEGEAPDWHWDEQTGVKGKQPSPDHKRGFSVMLFIKDIGWREWSANQVGVLKGMTAFWVQIDPHLKDNAGKVCRVKYDGAKAETIGKGSTRIPQMMLVDWVDPPKEIEAVEKPATEAKKEDIFF